MKNGLEGRKFHMTYAFMIEPQDFIALDNEDELIEKCQEWGLLSGKATKLKTFYYKGNGLNMPCTIIGYVDHMAAVIQLDNGQKHCIHPSYLKEMQASSYSARSISNAGSDRSTESITSDAVAPAALLILRQLPMHWLIGMKFRRIWRMRTTQTQTSYPLG